MAVAFRHPCPVGFAKSKPLEQNPFAHFIDSSGKNVEHMESGSYLSGVIEGNPYVCRHGRERIAESRNILAFGLSQ